MERSRPWPRLAPARTLPDVFGPGVAYVPRTSPSEPGWLTADPRAVDALAAGLLPCAAGLPFVASAGSTTPEILAWLEDAGLAVGADLRTYRTPAEYLALLRDLARSGLRLAMQHVHPAAEVDPAACLVDPGLQRFLNDKASLEALVPARLLATRHVVAVRDLAASAVLPERGRVVLKRSTPLPHGGGLCVHVCSSAADVEEARRAMGDDARVVVEEHVAMTRSVCVHAAVLPGGAVVPLGAAEQVCDDRGRYHGNWIDDAGAVPPEVTADVLGIVGRAAQRGYRGLAGVDVAFATDGRVVVLDLNFRSNGSTAGVLLRDDVVRRRGARVLRFRPWQVPGGFDALRRVADPAIARGTLLPRTGWDPAAAGTGGPARMSGFVLGDTREEVAQEEARLASAGLL